MEIRTIIEYGNITFELQKLEVEPDDYAELLGGRRRPVTYRAEVEYEYSSERGTITVPGEAVANSVREAVTAAVDSARQKLKTLQEEAA